MPEVFDCPIVSCRVIDGDSQEIVLDRGWGVMQTAYTRVIGIDAPEQHTMAGKLVTQVVSAWVVARLQPKYRLRWLSASLDKYGRSLGDMRDREHPEQSLAEYLLQNQLVRPYSGKVREPWSDIELDHICELCWAILG